MCENEVRTIAIPIDEYFELRTKAEINAMLLQQLARFEGSFF